VSPQELEALLHERIPLTQTLGCRVISAGIEGVRLRAPLAPNVNPHGTAFAGSLSSLALLAGWAWMLVSLRAENQEAAVVVRRCEIDYLSPVTGDFECLCPPPEAAAWNRFLSTLAKRRRARLDLLPQLSQMDGLARVRARCEYAVSHDSGAAPHRRSEK
jgi:thioesterase domain-containing protein